MITLQIVRVNTVAEVDDLTRSGYCPVQCAQMGRDLTVSPLPQPHEPAVAAYGAYFGLRMAEPKFVVRGFATANATFAIAALAGILPHPSRGAELASSSPPVRESGMQDLTPLAVLIDRHEKYPDTIRLEEEDFGDILLLWNDLVGETRDAVSFYGGVDRWRTLTGSWPRAHLRRAAREEEVRQRLLSQQARERSS